MELDRDELRQILAMLTDTRAQIVAHGPELDAYLAGVDDLAAELIGRGHVRPPSHARSAASRPSNAVLSMSNAGAPWHRRRQDA